MINPRYQGPAIPGYVFVTNNSSTTSDVRKRFSGVIPEDAFITLDNLVPGTASTTYVEDKYADIITKWVESIHNLLESLKALDREEEDYYRRINDDRHIGNKD